jgi:hypothetical protein
MPHYKHALIVIRDLRRTISDMVQPGKACHPERLEAIDEIRKAIEHIKNAERLSAMARLLDDAHTSLITDALQQIDWHNSKQLMCFGDRPQPEPPAVLRAED